MRFPLVMPGIITNTHPHIVHDRTGFFVSATAWDNRELCSFTLNHKFSTRQDAEAMAYRVAKAFSIDAMLWSRDAVICDVDEFERIKLTRLVAL